MRIVLLLLLCALAPAAFAQSGDRQGEVQVAPLKDSEIPPAPILSPTESLKSFKLQPGFRIELVASEPLIEAPIAMQFHPNGSLYVLEMRGFMPNVDGKGEDQPLGRVSILQDTNGDGKMDRSIVFLDKLVMPRGLGLAHDGVLVAEPPNLWFCRDTNGDFICDEKTLISTNYGSSSNPEHTANGFAWDLDNWHYSANYTNRFRRLDGKWLCEPTAVVSGRGQWGIAQDDFGRLVFNSNSDYLRGDLVPPDLLFRNPGVANPFGANVQFDRNQATFPARVNPGVNRGYQKGQLRPDGTLATFTAACGPVIYRGDQFEDRYRGAAFVCEPSANFVRCSLLSEQNGVITATNAFPNAEFLASTEERFRPVNLQNGPDGALYVVDMHRGVLQHRIYVTTYLRNQYLSRGLETPLDYGRIYRVVQENRPLRKIEPLQTNTVDLIASLNNANAWQRDSAQRLLVENADPAAVAPLAILAQGNRPDPAALHALWALDGMGKLDDATILGALNSQNFRTRATAVRLAGGRAFTNASLGRAIVRSAHDSNVFVQLHAAFALGPLATAANKDAQAALAEIVEAHAAEPLFRDAALSGLRGLEISFAETILARPAWNESRAGADKFLAGLIHAAAVSSPSTAINRALELAGGEKSWRREALLDGLLSLQPVAAAKDKKKPGAKPKPIHLAAEPPALAKLKAEPGLGEKLAALDDLLAWPGKPGLNEPTVKPLSKEEQARFDLGKQTFLLTCAACHQPHGLGQEGLAPPLVESEFVTGPEKRLARIILQGLRGPVTVNGKEYKLEMPPLAVLEDPQIAAVMTYVRREWNHTASPVTEEFVAKMRKEAENREEPWTEADLAKAP